MNSKKLKAGFPASTAKIVRQEIQEAAGSANITSAWPITVISGAGGACVAFDLTFEDLRQFSPPQITSDQNDYPTWSFSWLLLTSDAARNITGFDGGVPGRQLYLTNTGLNDISLSHEGTGSAAVDRISCPEGTSFLLRANGFTALLAWDDEAQRWRVIGEVGGNAGPTIVTITNVTISTVTNNNYSVTTTIQNITPTTNITFTGFSWNGGTPANGQLLIIINRAAVATRFTIRLVHNSASSTALNRLQGVDDLDTYLYPTQSCALVYDAALPAWRIVFNHNAYEWWIYYTQSNVGTDQNDYQLGPESVTRIPLVANVNFTGFVASDRARMQVVVNASSSFTLTLKHNSAFSAVGNRIWCPGATDLTIGANEPALLVYDLPSGYWKAFGGGGGAGGSLKNFVEHIYTASTTWLKPANLDFITIEVLPGGGGGAGAVSGTNQCSAGGGGSAGEYRYAKIAAGLLPASVAVTIGAGGPGGAPGAGGSDGGDSSFGALITSKHGLGGNAMVATATVGTTTDTPGGSGGSGGDIAHDGNPGRGGLVLLGGGPFVCLSGAGANSKYGSGGAGVNVDQVGNDASGYGSGGGGALSTSTPSNSGGSGKPGIEVVRDYFVGTLSGTGGIAGKFITDITGDGFTSVFPLIHPLGTQYVEVMVEDDIGWNWVLVDWYALDNNTVVIVFAAPPAAGVIYHATILG